VRDHYQKLGFSGVADGEDGSSQWILSVADFREFTTPIMTTGSDVRGQ